MSGVGYFGIWRYDDSYKERLKAGMKEKKSVWLLSCRVAFSSRTFECDSSMFDRTTNKVLGGLSSVKKGSKPKTISLATCSNAYSLKIIQIYCTLHINIVCITICLSLLFHFSICARLGLRAFRWIFRISRFYRSYGCNFLITLSAVVVCMAVNKLI